MATTLEVKCKSTQPRVASLLSSAAVWVREEGGREGGKEGGAKGGKEGEGEVYRRSSVPPLDDVASSDARDAAGPCRSLVERCFESRRPVVSEGEGARACVALPTVDRGKVTAVTTLHAAVDDATRLAMEVWTGREGRSELCLGEARYAGLDRFASLSHYVAFPRGSGLPGRAWECGCPQLLEGLSTSDGFLRRTGAEAEGLEVGLALPVVEGQRLRGVALLMWGERRPLARVVELWSPGEVAGSLRLVRRRAVYHEVAELADAADARLDLPAGDGWIGRAWATRTPETVHAPDGEALGRRGAAEAGLTSAVALPVVLLDDVRAVVVWMW